MTDDWDIPADERLIRLPEVMHRVGLGRSAIYQRIRERRFPAPIREDGIAWWRDSEVTAWIAARIRATRGAA
ncbi:helix-turn-helix transcriptional regulator [Roseospira goensis]|uniref:Prophage regulatory protein n=1 Tax=Roseospira goensis TaxID=391922 RepID=A0A7W6S2X6_9PROT|nr:AlpA family phage regulatory protein [Roseospira goensis]MBB4287915.1 prophage regulatory protein [Roseospira goensis]